MQFDVYAFQDEVIVDFAQNTFFIESINLCNFFHQLLRFRACSHGKATKHNRRQLTYLFLIGLGHLE